MYYEQGMGFFKCCKLPSVQDIVSGASQLVSNIRLPDIKIPNLPEIKLPNIQLPNLALPIFPPLNLDLSQLKINIPPPGEIVHSLSKAAGNLLNSDLNPVKLVERTMKNTPLLKDVWREVDTFSGGTLSQVSRLNDMPARALRGEAISKAEFAEAASLALKAGLLVVSGPVGSAAFNAALIGTASGQLKNGPLGETELGRAILQTGEIAGIAYATGSVVTDVMAAKAKDEAQARITQEATKKAGAAGAILATAATGKVANPESSFVNSVMEASKEEAKKQTALEIQKKTGVPATIASGLVEGKIPPQNEAQAMILNQAKVIAANEFEKKTGVPVALAAKIAEGKVPSVNEIKQEAYSNLRKASDELRAELKRIDEQIVTAPAMAKQIMIERKQAIIETVENRDKLIAEAREKGASELAVARQKVDEKITEADKLRLTQKNLKDRSEQLLAHAQATANQELKKRLTEEAQKLLAELMGLNPKREQAEQEAKDAIRDAEDLRQNLGFQEASIEFGAKDIVRNFSIGTGPALAIGAGIAAIGLLASGALG